MALRFARRYAPTVGSFLTVLLPGELMRCEVVELIDANRVVIEITGVPVSRAHQYRKGDRTGARRRVEAGHDVWEALDDRDFIANRSPNEPIKPEPKRKPAKKRRAA